jgi:integrase
MSPRYTKKPFSIAKQQWPSGSVVFYYYYYDERGKRRRKSTGIGYTRKRDATKQRKRAEEYCWNLWRDGRLGHGKQTPTLSQWVERKAFWDWRRSEYVRGKLARSSAERPAITETYVKNAAQITRDYILPYHGSRYIDEITAKDCEELLFEWVGNGASHKTANNRRSVYSTMMGEAERLGEIDRNPWRLVPELSAGKNHYGALTISEVARIIDPRGIDLAQERHRIYYYATRLAFLTGLRNGEVCGLLTDNVHDVTVHMDGGTATISYIEVARQYNPKTKRRELAKDKDQRKVPISPELRQELEPFLTGQGRYLFSFHPRQETPITPNRLREWLYARMETAGIPEAERKRRNIAFHSTRRFFNTLLRHERVADDVIQRFTGHDSAEMTDAYTDYLPQDLQAISSAQRKLVDGEMKE